MLVYVAETITGRYEQAFVTTLGVYTSFEKAEEAVKTDHRRYVSGDLKTTPHHAMPDYAVRAYELDGRHRVSYHLRGPAGWETSIQKDDGTWHLTSGVVKVG